MSLKSFHIFFISLSVLLTFGFDETFFFFFFGFEPSAMGWF